MSMHGQQAPSPRTCRSFNFLTTPATESGTVSAFNALTLCESYPNTMTYEARFLTHGDQVFDVIAFEAANDDAAILFGHGRFWSGIGKGYQLWQGGRLVETHLYVDDD